MYEILVVLLLLIIIWNLFFKSSYAKQIIWFSRPDCGYCTKMQPEWSHFKSMVSSDIALSKIDIRQNQKMADEYGVTGVPHIVKIVDGVRTVYSGDRSAVDLLRFANE